MTGQELGAFGNRLRFEASAFVYDNRRYTYADVRGLEYKQTAFQNRETDKHGVAGKIIYHCTLRVTFADGSKLVLKPENIGGLRKQVKTQDKLVADSIARAAEWLGVYTFDARMDAYEEQFKAKGFVSWGNYQINRVGELFYRNAYCLNLRSEDVRCMLYPFHLACVRKPRKWWKRLLGLILRRSEIIDLRHDRDCFLYFMQRRLAIRWPSEAQRVYRGVPADGVTPQQASQQETPKQEQPRAQQEQPRQEQARQAPPPPPPPPPRTMPSHPQHLAVLGLSPDVSWDVVRVTYRQLAKKHHPDLMRGRGASGAALKQAEETLKGINEAYSWLEDFYKLKR